MELQGSRGLVCLQHSSLHRDATGLDGNKAFARVFMRHPLGLEPAKWPEVCQDHQPNCDDGHSAGSPFLQSRVTMRALESTFTEDIRAQMISEGSPRGCMSGSQLLGLGSGQSWCGSRKAVSPETLCNVFPLCLAESTGGCYLLWWSLRKWLLGCTWFRSQLSRHI